MRRALSGWSRPPRELRRHLTQLDNVALVPASELGSLRVWQERAERLPAGETLVVVPSDNLRLLQVGRQISHSLSQRGRRAILTTFRPPAYSKGRQQRDS